MMLEFTETKKWGCLETKPESSVAHNQAHKTEENLLSLIFYELFKKV